MNSLLEALQEGRMVELPDDRNKDRALTILANLIEAEQHRREFLRRNRSSVLQCAPVRPAGLDFMLEQAPLKRERALPAFELRIERLPETA